MDKQNIFKSCTFHADTGDIVHVLVKDLVGTLPIISLNDSDGVEEDSTPDVPVATEETDSTYLGFTANWNAVNGAHGYYLDVATDAGFTSFVVGYQSLNVGNVTSYIVTAPVGTYYYRVSAYDNNITTAESNIITVLAPYTDIEYGILYNWWVASAANIAPAGWHVPSDNEYKTLEMFLGMTALQANGLNERGTDEGGKLKEIGLIHWDNPNTGATNEVGFNGRGNGRRNDLGIFDSLNIRGYLWTSTERLAPTAWHRILSNNLTTINRGGPVKIIGNAIRLIKDDAVDPGFVVDYDGNVYETVTIGTQVWMKSNLIVKHYNDGTVIPEVTDNATWGGLATGAWCYYNNDSNNM